MQKKKSTAEEEQHGEELRSDGGRDRSRRGATADEIRQHWTEAAEKIRQGTTGEQQQQRSDGGR